MDTHRFFQRPEFYRVGTPVFWLALGMSALTALVCGVAPALRTTRLDLASVAAERHGNTTSGTRLRRTLLAAQIALAAVLLTGAGLLTRAIDHVLSIDPGFALNELQTMSVQVPAGVAGPRGRAFFLRLDEALKQSGLPPVAIVDTMPLVDNRAVFPLRDREGQIYMPADRGVSPNYFDVMGIRLIAGRAAADGMIKTEEGTSYFETHEIVVSQSMAQHLWPGENPLGKIVRSGFRADELSTDEVVGVVADAASASIAEREPTVYQMGALFSPTLIVRDLSPAVVDRVRALATTIQARAIISSRPLTDVARDTLFATIVLSRVAWGIGALAVLLALVGAFGVFSYIVEERRREIGIRIALGARGPEVVRFVVGNTQRTVAAGLLLGFGLSAVLVPLLRRFLYGLSPFDPVSYLLVALILSAAVALATWIPARRATRVDPAVTLRSD
jgi:predicted permease